MNLVLTFVLTSAIAWWSVERIFGCPGLLWTHDIAALVQLKRSEQSAYLLLVFLVPAISASLAALFDRHAPQHRVESSPAPHHHLGIASKCFFFGVLPLVLYFGTPFTPLDGPVEHMDEGLRLAATAAFDGGGRLYQQVFLNYGPLYEIAQTKIGFSLFGSSIEGLRRIDRLWEPVGFLAAYTLLLLSLKRKRLVLLFVYVAVARPVWITPRLAFPFAAAACLVAAWSQRGTIARRLLLLVAGVFVSAAFFYSSEGGILCGSALALFYALEVAAAGKARERLLPVREAAYLGAGALTAAMPFLTWLIITGRLSDFFGNLATVSSTALLFGGKPTPLLCHPLRDFLGNPFVLFAAAGGLVRLWFPVLVYAGAFAAALRRLKNNSDREMLLVVLFGISFFMVTMGRWDIIHWMNGVGPFWVLAVIIVDRVVDGIFWREPDPLRRTFGIAAALAALAFLCGYLIFGSSPQRALDSLMSKPKMLFVAPHSITGSPGLVGNVAIGDADREKIKVLTEEIKRRVPAGRKLFVFSNDASLYYFTGIENSTPYSLECYLLLDSAVQKAISALESDPPACIVAVRSGTGIAYRPIQKPLANFILKNYRIDGCWNDYVFLVPSASSSSAE